MSKRITITVEGQQLKARLYKPIGDPKSIALLFIHGWTGKSNEDAAAFLAEHGYYVLTVNLRGHNGSDGDIEQVSRSDSLADAIAAYDFFRAQLPAKITIGAVGNSYGGYMVTVLSPERTLACLSIRVPANNPDEGFDTPHWGMGGENPATMKWRRAPHAPATNRSLRAVHEYANNIQIIEAELDRMVPHQCVQNYVDAVTDKTKLDYHLMKGWPHSLGSDPKRNKQFRELLLAWLEKQV